MESTRDFYSLSLGSNPSGGAISWDYSSIRLERRTHNPWVLGSSPSGPTIFNQENTVIPYEFLSGLMYMLIFFGMFLLPAFIFAVVIAANIKK